MNNSPNTETVTTGLAPDPLGSNSLVSNQSLTAAGFDVRSPGLATITDDATRTRILRAFRDEHLETSPVVRESIITGDGARARELLHKLMGSTATIGLPALRTAVIALHSAIHNGGRAQFKELCDTFEAELNRVLNKLDALGPADLPS